MIHAESKVGGPWLVVCAEPLGDFAALACPPGLPTEGYVVRPLGGRPAIGAAANDPLGLYWACQSLIQLLTVKDGKVVEQVSDYGAYSPTLGKSVGWDWVEIKYANVGEELELEHKNERTKIKLCRRGRYDPEGKKIRA